MKWVTDADKIAFSEQYARARDCQADFYADEIVDIADELAEDADSNAIQRARLRVDSRTGPATAAVLVPGSAPLRRA